MSLSSPTPICIFGPTAAGKTALSIALARALDGVIINADAMQVYRDLRVITARPSEEEVAQAPHRLFGVLDADDPCNAARWASLAESEITRAQEARKRPILVGGTGLYYRALIEGLDQIPTVDPEVRESVRQLSLQQLRDTLGVTVGDRQRLMRQLEILRQTGQPLESFYKARDQKPRDVFMITLMPPRAALYARIDRRFELMLADGIAQAEVRALLARDLPRTLPSMRAIGVPELSTYWRGERTLAQATAEAQQASRRYAKRQVTWARNQVSSDFVIESLLTDVDTVSQACDSVTEMLNITHNS